MQGPVSVGLGPLEVIFRSARDDVEDSVRNLLRAVARRHRAAFGRRHVVLVGLARARVRRRAGLGRDDHAHAQQVVHVLSRPTVAQHLAHGAEQALPSSLDGDARGSAHEGHEARVRAQRLGEPLPGAIQRASISRALPAQPLLQRFVRAREQPLQRQVLQLRAQGPGVEGVRHRGVQLHRLERERGAPHGR